MEVIVLLLVFVFFVGMSLRLGCVGAILFACVADTSVGVAAAFLFDDASCFAPVEFAVVVAGVWAKGVGGVAGEEGELSSCWSVLGLGL